MRGLGNNALRARAWPLLLGSSAGAGDGAALGALADAPHRDASTVDCDVQRSLWAFTEGASWVLVGGAAGGTPRALAHHPPHPAHCPPPTARPPTRAPGWPDGRRDAARVSLRRALNAAVASSGGRVHYYQGLHDVASVLLLVCGEVGAFRLLRQLAACQLRDCTRPTLDAALETLGLLMPILAQAGGWWGGGRGGECAPGAPRPRPPTAPTHLHLSSTRSCTPTSPPRACPRTLPCPGR